MVPSSVETKRPRRTGSGGKAGTRVPAPAKLPKTFRRKALDDAFIHFMQLSSPEQGSTLEIEVASKKILSLKIEFIGNDSFSELSSESKILGDFLFGTGLDETEVNPSKAPILPSHLARLCEAKLLTPNEEKSAFHRMNYLRFRADALKAKADAGDSWNVRRIECLLKAADWYRDWIVKSNMRLVISIVKKFCSSCPESATN